MHAFWLLAISVNSYKLQELCFFRSYLLHTGVLPYSKVHDGVRLPQAVAGGGPQNISQPVPVCETSLPVASTALPLRFQPSGIKQESAGYSCIHRKETVTLEEPPSSPPGSPSPLERPASALSSGSSEGHNAQELMSGGKGPSQQHIRKLLEDLFTSDSSDSG